MKDAVFYGGIFHQQGDGDALLDVKDIFIFAAVRRFFFSFAVAVQV